MKRGSLYLLAFVAALLVVAPVARADDEESDVITLTDKNWDKEVKEGFTLVEFYAPWCGHCKNLAPTWEKTATHFKDENIPCKVGKIDATAETKVAGKHSVSGFPTIKLFKDGEFFGDFDGSRTVDGFADFIEKAQQPALHEVSGADELDSFIEGQAVSFLLFGATASGGDQALKVFSTTAERYKLQGKTVAFASVEDPTGELAKTYEVTPGVPSAVVLNDGELAHFTGNFDKKSFEKFAKNNKMPHFAELIHSENFNELTRAGKLTVITIIDPDEDDHIRFKETMRAIGKSMRKKYVFCWMNAPSHSFMLDQIDVKEETWPAFIVFDGPKIEIFKDLTIDKSNPEEIKKFIEKVSKGKVKPTKPDDGKDEEKPKKKKAEKKPASDDEDDEPARPSGGSTVSSHGGAAVRPANEFWALEALERIEKMTEKQMSAFTSAVSKLGGGAGGEGGSYPDQLFYTVCSAVPIAFVVGLACGAVLLGGGSSAPAKAKKN